MVTLARLQPASKVQDGVRGKAPNKTRAVRANILSVAFFLWDQFISCRIAGILLLEFHRDPIIP